MTITVDDTQVQRVVLAWSAADVERHAERESIVIPLTSEGFIAARRGCSGKVIDTASIMGATKDIAHVMLIQSQLVEEELVKLTKKEPWISSILRSLEMVLGHVLLWDKLIHSIWQMMDKVPFEIIPPLAFEQRSLLRDDDWKSFAARDSFWICVESLERRGHITLSFSERPRRPRYQKEFPRFLRRMISSVAGYLVNRMAGFLLCERSKERSSQRWPKTDLLLVGLIAGDAVHQAPLAQRLSARFGDAFLWLSCSKEEILRRGVVITPEEGSYFDAMDKHAAHWIPSDEVPKVVWKHPLFCRLTDAYACWSVAGIFSKTVQSLLSRSDWFDYFNNGHVKYIFSDLRLQYERWRRFLDAASPRVVCAFSLLGDMAFIRHWARRKAVPFVLLPHGVFPSIRWQYHVDGDYLGVFGRIVAEQVQASGISKAREVALCGSMQFGIKSPDPAKTSDSPKTSGQRSLLYIVTFSFCQFFPSSVGQRFKEFEELHRACRSVDAELVVREHPRGGRDWLRPFVEELETRFPGTIRLSKEPSLFKDFSSAGAVVASRFDGAVLNALLSEKIVVAYLSEDSWNSTLEILAKMGCLVRTQAELEHVLRIVLGNGKEASKIRHREQEFLEEYIEDPSGDPWARAQELIAKVLERARLSHGVFPRLWRSVPRAHP